MNAGFDPFGGGGSDRPDPQTLDLVGRAKAGDSEAYDQLFGSAAERILLFLRVRLGAALAGKLEPMDILQDTYAEAHKAFRNFEYQGDGSFIRWLCRIAENQIRAASDYMGAAKRKAPGEQLPVTRVMERARATATGPATALGRVEVRERLAWAMGQLEDDERQAVLLRYFQDRTIDEVAELLGKSATATRRLLGRALGRLGSLLGDEEKKGGAGRSHG